MQLIGHVDIRLENKGRLPNPATYKNKANYRLPFSEEWLTVNGGTSKENSHSWSILTQRYAYDFIIVNENGLSYKNEGKDLNDYFCFGKEILCPADGIIVEIQNTIKDYKRVGDNSIDWKTKDFRGNYLIIQHAKDEFSFIAHLKQKSIKVKVGDSVTKSQALGLCGNSGHSTEPHIHFHLQSKKNFWTAASLPIRFAKISRKQNAITMIKEHSYIEKNELVKNV